MAIIAAQADPLISVTTVANRLNVVDRTVRKWIEVGLRGKKLRAIRAADSGMWKIAEADLQEFLTSNEDPREEAIA